MTFKRKPRVTITPNPHFAAQSHFAAALAFYTDHGQEESAIARLTAGMLALSAQVARIELAVMEGYEC